MEAHVAPGKTMINIIIIKKKDLRALFFLVHLFCLCVDKRMQKKLLISHIKAIRSKPRFRNSIIIFVPEANLGLQHQYLANELKGMKNVYIFRGSSGTPGVKTLPYTKPLFVEKADDLLSNEAVFMDPDFVCANPYSKADDKSREIKEMWKKQLFTFKRYVIPPKTVNSRGYVRYSGKADPEGNVIRNGEDDLIMAWVINCWVANQVYKRRTDVPIDYFKKGGAVAVAA
jgi:hypothetical protein